MRTGALDATWSGLLLVAYRWTAGGGIQDLRSCADGLTSAGRLTGLLASFLLLVQLLLMARLPLVERAYGQERLARTRRLVGFASFTLMIAHVGLLIGRLAVSSPKRRSPTAPTMSSAAPGAG